MKAQLSLEFIGAANYDALRRFEAISSAVGRPQKTTGGTPWVARMYRDESGRASPEFLSAKRDYSGANSRGTRGVMLHFILRENEIYWVHQLTSWSSHKRYYVAVKPDGSVYELSNEEAEEWLSAL